MFRFFFVLVFCRVTLVSLLISFIFLKYLDYLVFSHLLVRFPACCYLFYLYTLVVFLLISLLCLGSILFVFPYTFCSVCVFYFSIVVIRLDGCRVLISGFIVLSYLFLPYFMIYTFRILRYFSLACLLLSSSVSCILLVLFYFRFLYLYSLRLYFNFFILYVVPVLFLVLSHFFFYISRACFFFSSCFIFVLFIIMVFVLYFI